MTTTTLNNDVLSFYQTNENFRNYVDKYSATHKIPVDEALKHMMVKNVMEYYKSE